MENSKKFLKDHNILPKISFNDGEPRTLTIVDDKLDTTFDQKKQIDVDCMTYKVTENGEVKKFSTQSITLIAKLSEVEKDDVVKIQQTKYKTATGFKKTYKVSKIEGENEVSVEGDIPPELDIPILEE